MEIPLPVFTSSWANTPAEISTWRNKFFDLAVVQALSKHDAERGDVFRRDRCVRWRSHVFPLARDGRVRLADGGFKEAIALIKDDRILGEDGKPTRVTSVHVSEHLVELGVEVRPCPGTSKQATSSVLLDRRDALHAVYGHYLFANQSICRFHKPTRGKYAADLIFEIDVHDAIEGCVVLDWFGKYVGAAVAVGRRLVDHLISVLLIDPKYITVSITRMGARVTVDWRAFGPHRLHQLMLVVRYIEACVFADGELAELSSKVGVPKVAIDAGIYNRSDLPRVGVDDSNGFIGPWLRPVGAMHSKSGQGGWWYRTTPVPLEKFQAGNTAWLVKESRGRDADWRGWPNRELPANFVWRVPESRNPKLDAFIESDPKPAWKLIELFERDNLLDVIRDEHREDVVAAQNKARPSRLHVQRDYELDAAAIETFVTSLAVDTRERPNRWELDCPRSGCKQRGKKGAIFRETGVFTCWRCCTGGMSLVALAAELGMSGRLPSRVASSTPMSTMPIADVPKPKHLIEWGEHVEIIERTFGDPKKLWADRRRELERFRDRDNARLLIDASDLGTGKSTVTRQMMRDLGIRHRSLVPRDEAKLDYLGELDDAVAIQGRRLGINCTNDALNEVLARREPVAKTLCSVCQNRSDCGYRKQFEGINDKNIILSHAHGGMAHFDIFDNGAEIDVVDEDALGAVAQHDELDADELDRFRVGIAFDFDDSDDVTLDAEAHPSGATAALEKIIDRLQTLLTTDAVVHHDVRAGRDGELVDLDLAKYLLDDPELREAINALDEDDIKEHEARRFDLLKKWQDDLAGEDAEVIGHIYPERFEAEWMQSEQRAAAIAGNDHIEELMAWHDWTQQHLEPVHARRDARIHRRPKDIMRELQRGLYAAYFMGNTGTNRPLAMQAYRPDDAGSWVLRLTTRRPFLSESKKVIHLSATAVPERLRLLYGQPASTSKWIIYKASLSKKERRVVVADKTYSRSSIFAKKADVLRNQLIETVDKLIESEHVRTALPAAIIGASRVMNWYLEHRLGKAARDFTMPFKGAERADKIAGLKALTLPLGFIAGYAGGVAGSNDFAVEEEGVKRFVRSLVVLGNIIPNLTNVARDHRGLFAHMRDEPVDWTQTFRTVAFEGTEHDGHVQVAKNVIGYRDDAANAILHGIYEGELLQIVGRMRGQLADPIDPNIVPTVFMFGSVAIPAWPVDDVIALDELRGQLGLAVKEAKPRGRRSVVSLDEQIRRRWAKHGPAATMRWLVKLYFAVTKDDTAVTAARLAIERAGIKFSGGLVAVGNAVITSLSDNANV